MADKIAFDLVSPEKLLLSDQADMVTVPGTEGYMGVMAGHSPVISTLRPGTINVQGSSDMGALPDRLENIAQGRAVRCSATRPDCNRTVGVDGHKLDVNLQRMACARR